MSTTKQEWNMWRTHSPKSNTRICIRRWNGWWKLWCEIWHTIRERARGCRDELSTVPRCTKNIPKRVFHYRLSSNHRLYRSDDWNLCHYNCSGQRHRRSSINYGRYWNRRNPSIFLNQLSTHTYMNTSLVGVGVCTTIDNFAPFRRKRLKM